MRATPRTALLVLAVLMVAGGRLADAYGRKKVFLIGMGIGNIGNLADLSKVTAFEWGVAYPTFVERVIAS